MFTTRIDRGKCFHRHSMKVLQLQSSIHIWLVSKYLQQTSGYSDFNYIHSSILTFCPLNEDNLVQAIFSSPPSNAVSSVLQSSDPTNGLPQCPWIQRSALAALGCDLHVLYLSHSGETLALRCAHSRGSVQIWRERPATAFCHVSIIQSDVWVICFSILKTSHINSSHQDVCHPTS